MYTHVRTLVQVCEEGKLSATDRTSCGDCASGTYVYKDKSCESCPSGTYAPQALADQCLDCGVGA